MQCPKCGNHFEIVIKEVTEHMQAPQQQPEQPLVQAAEAPLLERQISEPPRRNKVSDDDFATAQRLLSFAAQGRSGR